MSRNKYLVSLTPVVSSRRTLMAVGRTGRGPFPGSNLQRVGD